MPPSLLLISLLGVLVAPQLAPYDPMLGDVALRLQPPAFLGGDAAHWLGTDPLGRDILSRLLHGARTSLLIASAATTAAFLIGAPAGLISGYYRGGRGSFLWMRVAETTDALPTVLVAMALIGILGNGVVVLVSTLTATRWVSFARLTRAETLRLREEPFITAAQAVGAGSGRIIRRHLLPNIAPGLIVTYTTTVARVMLIESSLSFLGLGIQPPAPTLGGMINSGRTYITGAWWASVMPGLALVVLIVIINGFGDWLRDRQDGYGIG